MPTVLFPFRRESQGVPIVGCGEDFRQVMGDGGMASSEVHRFFCGECRGFLWRLREGISKRGDELRARGVIAVLAGCRPRAYNHIV